MACPSRLAQSKVKIVPIHDYDANIIFPLKLVPCVSLQSLPRVASIVLHGSAASSVALSLDAGTAGACMHNCVHVCVVFLFISAVEDFHGL